MTNRENKPEGKDLEGLERLDYLLKELGFTTLGTDPSQSSVRVRNKAKGE
jgi:hypothetical protein